MRTTKDDYKKKKNHLSKKDLKRREEGRDRKRKRKPLQIKKKEGHIEKVFIDINALEGNTSNLLALAKKWSDQLKLNYNAIYDEMMSCEDRPQLLEVFKSHFGQFVMFYE